LPPVADGAPGGGAPGPAPVGGLSTGMAGMLEKLEALQAGGKGPDSTDGAADGENKPNDAHVWTPAPQHVLPEPQKEVEYNEEGLPIRPGMQKCGFFLKSGKCTYGPTCRFDHPAGLGGLMAGGSGFGFLPGTMGGPMTEGGMAMRPGREQCPFLARTGACPFGPECRFDHSGTKDSNPNSLSKPIEAPVSRKKEKGLGGTRGRRPPPSGARRA